MLKGMEVSRHRGGKRRKEKVAFQDQAHFLSETIAYTTWTKSASEGDFIFTAYLFFPKLL